MYLNGEPGRKSLIGLAEAHMGSLSSNCVYFDWLRLLSDQSRPQEYACKLTL